MRVAILPSGALLADTAPGQNEASDGLSVSARARVAGKRIGDDRLSAVFGIELEDAPPVRAARARRPSRRGKPRPSRVSERRR